MSSKLREGASSGGGREIAVSSFLAQRWPWLGRLFLGRLYVGDVMLNGFAVRVDGPKWQVIVRGLYVRDMRFVVAFGSADSLYKALGNVTATIQKGGWRADRFRGKAFIAGGPDPAVSDDEGKSN